MVAGTSPLTAYRHLASKTSTGSGSLIAATSPAAASAGVLGTTTFRPGIIMAQFSTLCECWAANPTPPPLAHRMTSGSRICPPDMNRVLAIWLATTSQQTAKKSLNMISATGFIPAMAAPMAAPAMACSEIGVSRIRSPPNSAYRPLVVLNTPPSRPTSSPSTSTSGSAASSWRSAASTASR